MNRLFELVREKRSLSEVTRERVIATESLADLVTSCTSANPKIGFVALSVQIGNAHNPRIRGAITRLYYGHEGWMHAQ